MRGSGFLVNAKDLARAKDISATKKAKTVTYIAIEMIMTVVIYQVSLYIRKRPWLGGPRGKEQTVTLINTATLSVYGLSRWRMALSVYGLSHSRTA